MTRDEIDTYWFDNKKINGARFRLNDPVQFHTGVHVGKFGSVISLLYLEPNPIYLVELSNGEGIESIETDLTPVTEA